MESDVANSTKLPSGGRTISAKTQKAMRAPNTFLCCSSDSDAISTLRIRAVATYSCRLSTLTQQPAVPMDTPRLPQRFTFLPNDDFDRTSTQSQRSRAANSLLLTRGLLSAELLISLGFNVALLYAVRHGQHLSILLCILATSNLVAAATLLFRRRPLEKASAIAVYVIWKVFQEIVLVPVLLIFTVLMAEGFVDTGLASTIIFWILVVIWLYAVYSMTAILLLGHVARTLWKTKIRKRRCSIASVSTVTQPLELSFESEHSTSELPRIT